MRLDRYLRDPDTTASLSDRYFTLRSDRDVLPVLADARGQIRGIVHDASGSGTTLFIGREALVELNNRHEQAELEIEREVLRVRRKAVRSHLAESRYVASFEGAPPEQGGDGTTISLLA